MSHDAISTLRNVNQKIRDALVRFRPDQHRCSAITPADFSGLLAELLCAAECLRKLEATSSVGQSAPLEQEKLEYRNNLENLKHVLPDLHTRLVAEKRRLQRAGKHVASATAWAKASKRTL
jgi:hypothetical protein